MQIKTLFIQNSLNVIANAFLTWVEIYGINVAVLYIVFTEM